MDNYLFTSEAVSAGHPDKVADQISDAVLDACLTEDRHARVACEVLVTRGLAVLAGEISTTARVDYQEVTRRTIKEIGYTDPSTGFDWNSCSVITAIQEQSPDIAQGVDLNSGLHQEMGAGDQGLVFGFACDDTPQLMPMPHVVSHELLEALDKASRSGRLPWLRPDAKSQVTVEYDAEHRPHRLHTVIVSTQHSADVNHDTVVAEITKLIQETAPSHLLDERTILHINPTGRFVIGGPAADTGLTGRKPIVDTYGAMGRHGGGAFSGKDPTKVDRSAAYAARYVAKNVVAAKLARRCEIQISYAIGVAQPVAIYLDTWGTGTISNSAIASAIPQVFDLTPSGIISSLDMLRPIYRRTSYGGHFGKEEPEFLWENTDRVQQLLDATHSLC